MAYPEHPDVYPECPDQSCPKENGAYRSSISELRFACKELSILDTFGIRLTRRKRLHLQILRVGLVGFFLLAFRISKLIVIIIESCFLLVNDWLLMVHA
jgi:hypothetical protein